MKKIIRMDNGRTRVQVVNESPTLTQQHMRDQCDVNKIVAKYKKTGEWLHLTSKKGVYADVSHVTDYHDSLNKVLEANSAFSSLPSHIRLRFQNDPAQLLEFLQDDRNYDEALKLGLVEPKNTSEPEKNEPTENKKTNSKTIKQNTEATEKTGEDS